MKDDIRAQLASEPESLAAVGRESEHDDARLGLEDRLQSRGKELVVVGDEDSDGVGVSHRVNSKPTRC
jgi:hypothetical protein